MEEESLNTKAKGSDPGWNDPPTFAYSAEITKTKTNLNKRVAFPLQSTTTQNIQTHGTGLPLPLSGNPNCGLPPKSSTYSPLSLPPQNNTLPPVMPPLLSVTLNKPQSSLSNEPLEQDLRIEDSSEKKREYCLNIFDQIILAIPLNSNVEEIRKRINLMNTNWIEDKLNLAIQNKLCQLARALQNKNISDATSIHRSLVVDNIGEKHVCSYWAPALRQLILSLEEPITNKSTEDFSNNLEYNPTISMIGVADFKSDPLNVLTETKNETKKNFSKIYHI